MKLEAPLKTAEELNLSKALRLRRTILIELGLLDIFFGPVDILHELVEYKVSYVECPTLCGFAALAKWMNLVSETDYVQVVGSFD
jgi:hypothetical protein